MRNQLKALAFFSYLVAFGGIIITIAAMYAYNDMQAAMIATIIYICAPIIGVTFQTMADA